MPVVDSKVSNSRLDCHGRPGSSLTEPAGYPLRVRSRSAESLTRRSRRRLRHAITFDGLTCARLHQP